MSRYIEHCEWMGDWFALRPHGGTSVEGPAEEWLAVADRLDCLTDESPHFKRLALRLVSSRWELWSPRNAHSVHDCATVSVGDGPRLAAQIRECVGAVAFALWSGHDVDEDDLACPREAP